jgi:hypothetical protein
MTRAWTQHCDADSDDALSVVGGLSVFKVPLAHARHLALAGTDEPAPGDIVFDDRETAGCGRV